MTEVLKQAADAINSKPVSLEIDHISACWWEKMAIRMRILPATKRFEIRPATLGTMIRISQLLLEIDPNIFKSEGTALDSNYQLYGAHGDNIARVVAAAIENREAVPSEKLVAFIKNNLSASELMAVIKIVLQQLNVMGFMSTIISLRGMSLLNTEGTIASGE
ncbi:hypothetical protein [Chitinophaga varians]|uniref:hypothetical protein n=1 Tax=Chitinophaga varians TaxID=2202339 RepID=UPI00165F1560|nr:hypothetical protein [Chitinophaga varians]MBC9913188.1 hypothetical protein [Chitinophaga varians]